MKGDYNSSTCRLPVLFFISFLMGLFFCAPALSYVFPAWNEGSSGYELSLLEAERDEKPSILYLYIEPSLWCDKFNKDYLDAPEVEKFLAEFPKAAVNTDGGDAESEMTKKFGAVNFPAFFILIPSFDIKPERIHPFSQKGNMSVSEFLQSLKDFMTSHYNQKAYSYYEDKDYDNAIKYFEMSIEIDPEKAYTYFAIGIVYHYVGVDKKDKEILQKAEEYYLKALEIEPKHKQSRDELETLRENMEKI